MPVYVPHWSSFDNLILMESAISRDRGVLPKGRVYNEAFCSHEQAAQPVLYQNTPKQSLLTMSSSKEMETEWRQFIRKHWRATGLFVLLGALAIAWAVYVFVWFVSNAQSSSLVPSTLGLWTIGNLVTFIVYAILWELLLVGIPVAIGGVLAWRWWKSLPETEKMDYHMRGRKRATGGGGGALLLFILFCIKVYIDGKWNSPISTFTLDYVVGSMILILVIGAIVFGVPAAIALTWWLRRETKTPVAG